MGNSFCKASILVVDDDLYFAVAISRMLEKVGYQVERASNGEEALQLYYLLRPDLMLLDVVMPGINGVEICTRLRSHLDQHKVAVILLTTASEDPSFVADFKTYADDYLTKPFEFTVLLSRITDILHRTNYIGDLHNNGAETEEILSYVGYTKASGRITMAGLTLDMDKARVTTDRGTAKLTPLELNLLHFLMTNNGRVFSSKELIELVWNDSPQKRNLSLIRRHIKNLRRKIEAMPENPQYIKTVSHHGYLFEV